MLVAPDATFISAVFVSTDGELVPLNQRGHRHASKPHAAAQALVKIASVSPAPTVSF